MDIINQILEALAKAIEYAPFLATVGGFALLGQLAKEIFTKKKANTKGKYQKLWFLMRLSLPLHPLMSGVALGLLDSSHGVGYYTLAGVLSVFLFDLVKRFTGYKVDLVDDSIPPKAPK